MLLHLALVVASSVPTKAAGVLRFSEDTPHVRTCQLVGIPGPQKYVK